MWVWQGWSVTARWRWGLVVLLVVILVGSVGVFVGRMPGEALPFTTLIVTSQPSGASVVVGGKERGRTPLTLSLPVGDARVTLRLADHAAVSYDVRLVPDQPTTLAAILWRQAPTLLRLRPPLPGLVIVGAQFLGDGRLVLVAALPEGDERQLWLLDATGGARRIGPTVASGALAITADGQRVAYLLRGSAGRASEVWVSARADQPGEHRWSLPPNTADERLVDLAWAPEGDRLLLVSQLRPPGGGLRSRLLLLSLATGVVREVIVLPSEVVPGSLRWSPHGDRLALLTRTADRTVLCLVGNDGTTFRSLTDLPGAGQTTLAFTPLAWSPAGSQVAYTTPADTASGGNRPPALVTENLQEPATGATTGGAGAGPAWRADGLLLAFARPKSNGPVVVRAFVAVQPNAAQDLWALSLPAGIPAGALWDLPHAQALVALRGLGGQPDLWLVRWQLASAEVQP